MAVGAFPAQAQTLTFSLFERYLDSLREQAGIPGLSAAIVQNGSVVWERGLGRQDVDGNVPASPETPYYIGDLSQTMGAALALRKCVEQDTLELSDRITRWVPDYPDANATVANLLTHTTNGGSFEYSLDRFAGLTSVIVECADQPYRHVLYEEVFNRFGDAELRARDGVHGIGYAGSHAVRLGHLGAVRRRGSAGGPDLPVEQRPDGPLRRVASLAVCRDWCAVDGPRPGPLRHRTPKWCSDRNAEPDGVVDTSCRAGPHATDRAGMVRSELHASTGNGEPLIWQFGLIRDGHSALLLKLPRRNLTLILLANSDAMTSGYNLNNGDVTTSPFATLFLRFFVP